MEAAPPNAVSVTVVNGAVTCTPDPVPVKAKDSTLTFSLDSAGYVFAPDNAVVVTEGGDQFPEPSRTHADGKKATLRDVNSRAGDFKYAVTVRPAGGGDDIVFDPTIRNEP